MSWTKMNRPCNCDFGYNECIVPYYINEIGVLRQNSSDMINCGKVQKQLEACGRLSDFLKKERKQNV